QMEMQYFVKPGTDDGHMNDWMEIRKNFYLNLGFNKENIRFHAHGEGELAHYAKAAFDVQYKFPIGWQELEGIHNRTNFDLSQHQKFSGKSLEYFEESTKEKFVPYVIETAAGCDRLVLASLCDAYREEITTDDKGNEDTRVVLGFHPRLAPVKMAFLPLSKKEPLVETALKLRDEFSERDMVVQYDESGSIGKRYRRQDEIGTPLCVTVDFETATDGKVTVRHRDKMTQDRVPMDQLLSYADEKFKNF
ncbi:MAG: glycine--tRNA ligase, partial [Bdellovibrionales bacterium]|nr:glycine--tRNA ligase [Bdellovibrionales bacterium]